MHAAMQATSSPYIKPIIHAQKFSQKSETIIYWSAEGSDSELLTDT